MFTSARPTNNLFQITHGHIIYIVFEGLSPEQDNDNFLLAMASKYKNIQRLQTQYSIPDNHDFVPT